MLSAVMEDYLKAIYELHAEGHDRVSTSALAERMDVTPPTVTSMLEKLAQRDLVEREKYEGVELTTDGEGVAIEVIRHHRLLEAYLTDELDYSWEEVHEEADRLEHHISEEFEARVAATLGHPRADPHGDPIPNAELDRPDERAGDALTAYEETDVVRVLRVHDRDATVLEYLADRGIEPGTELTVEEVAPFGMLTVRPTDADKTVSLPERIARGVRVDAVAHPIE